MPLPVRRRQRERERLEGLTWGEVPDITAEDVERIRREGALTQRQAYDEAMVRILDQGQGSR
jgi:hypothetical protein